MRRFLMALAISAIAVAPGWALGGNQEVAQQIANRLRNSGRLSDYDIKIKFENGDAWLAGRVNDEGQRTAAMAIAREVPGVRRVYNEMLVGQAGPEVQAAEFSTEPALIPETSPVQQTSAPVSQPVLSRRTAAPSRLQQPPAQRMVPQQRMAPQQQMVRSQRVPARTVSYPVEAQMHGGMQPTPAAHAGYVMGTGMNAGAAYDQPNMPNYAWPSYAAHPNYEAVAYPRMYSPTAWPYIGPFYPYPQVPLGWRKVSLEWDDGWWMLDFDDTIGPHGHP